MWDEPSPAFNRLAGVALVIVIAVFVVGIAHGVGMAVTRAMGL